MKTYIASLLNQDMIEFDRLRVPAESFKDAFNKVKDWAKDRRYPYILNIINTTEPDNPSCVSYVFRRHEGVEFLGMYGTELYEEETCDMTP